MNRGVVDPQLCFFPRCGVDAEFHPRLVLGGCQIAYCKQHVPWDFLHIPIVLPLQLTTSPFLHAACAIFLSCTGPSPVLFRRPRGEIEGRCEGSVLLRLDDEDLPKGFGRIVVCSDRRAYMYAPILFSQRWLC